MFIQKDYQLRNHSKFPIKYHVIFACKYRSQVFRNQRIDENIKQIMFNIAKESDCDIEVMETDRDHIHLMIRSIHKLSPLQIVRKLKQESTHRIWNYITTSSAIHTGENTHSGLTVTL